MPSDIVTVGHYPSLVDAELARAILAANGIDAIVLTDDAGGMLPSLNLLLETRLAVRAEDAEAAQTILADHEA